MTRARELNPLAAAHAPDLQIRLWSELGAAGVLPDRAVYASCRAEISSRGLAARSELVPVVGESTWRSGLHALRRPAPEDDCVRVLGFGSALADFFVAPVGLAPGARERVVRLGALANLIVTTYDHLCDLDGGRSPVLPRWLLRRRLRAPGASVAAVFERCLPAPSRLVAGLLDRYWRSLGQLAQGDGDPRALGCLRRAILQMYDAESRTVRRNRGSSAADLRRKVALPFVVMGLPAWLETREARGAKYEWHLRWLYRVGAFFGRIDDVVDLAADVAERRPNAVARLLAQSSDPEATGTSIARATARAGRRLLDEWHGHVPARDVSRGAAHAVPTCVVSWLGGWPDALEIPGPESGSPRASLKWAAQGL